MVGTVLAELEGRRFVGSIDADNFVPGVVHEYCKVFAISLYQAFTDHTILPSDPKFSDKQPLVMVRIKWKSKSKILDGKLVHQTRSTSY